MPSKVVLSQKTKTLIEGEIEKWAEDFEQRGGVQDFVHQLLTEAISDVVWWAIGLRYNSWDKNWELDTVNARHMKSPLGRRIMEQVENEVQAWITDYGIALPPLSDKERRELTKFYKNHFIAAVQNALSEMAYQNGREFANALVENTVWEKLQERENEKNQIREFAPNCGEEGV